MSNKIAGEIGLTRMRNRDEIRRLTARDTVIGIDTHEKWLEWVNELDDRVNWGCHLDFMMDHAYWNDKVFDPDDVRWTLEDYKYNRKRV